MTKDLCHGWWSTLQASMFDESNLRGVILIPRCVTSGNSRSGQMDGPYPDACSQILWSGNFLILTCKIFYYGHKRGPNEGWEEHTLLRTLDCQHPSGSIPMSTSQDSHIPKVGRSRSRI